MTEKAKVNPRKFGLASRKRGLRINPNSKWRGSPLVVDISKCYCFLLYLTRNRPLARLNRRLKHVQSPQGVNICENGCWNQVRWYFPAFISNKKKEFKDCLVFQRMICYQWPGKGITVKGATFGTDKGKHTAVWFQNWLLELQKRPRISPIWWSLPPPTDTPKSKNVALFYWRLVFHVWSFITPSAFLVGEDYCLLALCVRRSLCIPCMLCMEPQVNKGRGCVFHTKQRTCQLRPWEYGIGILRFMTAFAHTAPPLTKKSFAVNKTLDCFPNNFPNTRAGCRNKEHL